MKVLILTLALISSFIGVANADCHTTTVDGKEVICCTTGDYTECN